ncbi:MAG TPA: rhodanese-like domain-containing protein [Solirubrobacteraceae bacterium]|nr:rhodanese-like domain-containing protein [Solirubrobacteraceae bacterium]
MALTLDELFARASARLTRLSAHETAAAAVRGAVLIDIRGDDQIADGGTIPGALIIARNVLEWRLAPDSDYRHPQAPGIEQHVVIVCQEGYQSVLVAATLQDLGFARATDLDGGFCAWRAAGLPVVLGRRCRSLA